MLSASPDALMGVDPDDTETVEYGGASFTIGTVPAGEWDVLEARHHVARQNATRRAIKALHDSGVDPEAVRMKTPNGELTEADMAVLSDPLFVAETNAVYLDAARLSIRGHKNFVNRRGEEFPFKAADSELPQVHPDVMRIYGHNGKLLRSLWFHIRNLNDMGAIAKKA